MRRLAATLALLLGGCSLVPAEPPQPPPDGPGDCATACDNLEQLGCGLGADCLGLCESAASAESDVGERLPVGCLTAADSCGAAALCR